MYKITLLFVFVCFGAQIAGAQAVSVKGDVPKPVQYSAAQISAMKHITLKAKGHDEKMHSYSGVLLFNVIKGSDVVQGKALRGKNMAKFLLVKAADGYKAVFALPEIDPEFAEKTILLADQVDGKPLSKETGPLQIIVPGERKHARWVRQVQELEIRTAE
ncbi:MAG: molybdopterin-dependent oxidoreductase [Mucilaginibacter polytrichastri]|nr:molybdopterin-dependent oxidoreductase [Mucilaginibacter polytrichastri]